MKHLVRGYDDLWWDRHAKISLAWELITHSKFWMWVQYINNNVYKKAMLNIEKL